MPTNDLLFIQPLLDMNENWAGYLVECAADAPSDPLLLRLAEHPAVREFNLRHPWLLPARPCLADKRTISQAVYLFPTNEPSLQPLEKLLREEGRSVGLALHPDDRLPASGTWNFVVLGAGHARTLPPYTLLGLSSRTHVVATGVHARSDFLWGRTNAWHLSSAEFLLTRNNTGPHADLTRVKLLEILALIAEDADTGALEEIFRQEPKLSYSLLRLVNSAAMAPRSPIASFGHAINLLGRRQLQRWLQLLVFADPNNGNHPNPLLQKAAARGRLMELLAPSLQSGEGIDNLADAAFMVGVFSLLDVLLNMSMSEILQQLPLATHVRQALAEQTGPLGRLLRAISASEHRDLEIASQLLRQNALPGETFLDAQLAALGWASRIHAND